MLRIIRIVVSPRDEWERIAADGWLPALTYLSVLSLLPTFASFINVRNSLARMFSPGATLERCSSCRCW